MTTKTPQHDAQSPRRATIRDVARAAQVSPATVSRAFTQPQMVSNHTRTLIERTAVQLGYLAATSPAAQNGRPTIGLLVPDVANPFFAPIMKGVQAHVKRRSHGLFIADSDEIASAELEIATALAKQVDGLIIASSRMQAKHLQHIAARVPTVLLGRSVDGVSAVLTTADLGLTQAVEHLAALGHTEIAYMRGPDQSYAAQTRITAIQRALEHHGVHGIEFGPFEARIEEGVRAADLIHASGATAAIAYNDQTAFGLMSRLAARGVAIPADLSVVGVDDSWLASLTAPSLTSVRVPVERAARLCVEILFRQLDGKSAPHTETLESDLIVRDSTAPHPRRV